jgi:hypothetical protein
MLPKVPMQALSTMLPTSVNRSAENLVDAGDALIYQLAERLVQVRDRMDCDLGHVEQHPLLRELRERRPGAAEPDVQQLDQRVVLNGVEFH